MRILIVEDDPDLAELLVMGLRDAAYAADHAPTLAAARHLMMTTSYDLACVDLGLPDGDGLDLIRSLGAKECRPPEWTELDRPGRIIAITARDAIAQRISGLDAGADDYLVKPFDFDELLARVRAVSRRSDQHSNLLQVCDITLDTTTLTVTRGDKPIALTPRELALLRYFMHHPGEVLSAEHLLEHVWDTNTDPFTTSVRVILSRLRRKLGEPAIIHTMPSLGYRLGTETARQ